MRKVFLENLPKKYGRGANKNKLVIDWKNSIGLTINFEFDEITGELIIDNYKTKGNVLTVSYKNKKHNIQIGALKQCGLQKVLGFITKDFRFNVGDRLEDKEQSITIIERTRKPIQRKNRLEYRKCYKYHCNRCGNEGWLEENNIINNTKCNVCVPRGRKKAVLGINTIWDTDRWMCDLGVSVEDAKRYTHNSGRKITVKCPDCGREKSVKITHIYTYKTIFCTCGDGKSYPEKFVMNVLEQLNINFETEYSPSWIKPKRYDFYIPKFNMIIEAHGGQHYDGSFKRIGGRTLEEEQQNDKYKREMALVNGIKHYIELDCRESSLDYIKNSILNSKLNKLFDLSNINWTSCAEFANKNIVKEVCDYWNNKGEDETTRDLAKEFKVDPVTIRSYLKKGTKLGWCR